MVGEEARAIPPGAHTSGPNAEGDTSGGQYQQPNPSNGLDVVIAPSRQKGSEDLRLTAGPGSIKSEAPSPSGSYTDGGEAHSMKQEKQDQQTAECAEQDGGEEADDERDKQDIEADQDESDVSESGSEDREDADDEDAHDGDGEPAVNGRSEIFDSDSVVSRVSSLKSYLDYSGDDTIAPPTAGAEDWDEDEIPKLQLNEGAIKHTATYYLPGHHGKCVQVAYRTRGGFHEIYDLHFADGWSCNGRFTRDAECLAKMQSDLGKSEIVRKHTSIPVLETYLMNFNPNHVVGSAFVFIEKMEGEPMHRIWGKASTERQLYLTRQIGEVVAQLADLRFDHIGSMKLDGSIGPLTDADGNDDLLGRGPFSTTAEYLFAFLSDDSNVPEEVRALYPQLRANILQHGDFDEQNFLFTQENESQPPKLSAVIEWDSSQTVPLYYLCNCPIFMQDVDCRVMRKYWKANKLARKLLLSTLLHHYPKGSSERKAVRWCFKEKSS